MAEPVEYFWFPWCTGQYKQSFINKKIPELEATGRYWGVKQVGWRIHVKLGRDRDGKTVWNRLEINP